MDNTVFLKVSGVQGQSPHHQHKGEFDVLSQNFSASHFASVEAGQSGFKGSTTLHDMQITTHLCEASVTMMKFCANGKTIPNVLLQAYRQAGDDLQLAYSIELKNAIVTHCSSNADGDSPTAHYAFNAEEMKYSFTEQTSTGGVGATTDVTFNQNTTKVS
jgi:type VI secretion system secreted protein Hcp